jgi:hypothetical protein
MQRVESASDISSILVFILTGVYSDKLVVKFRTHIKELVF